MFGIDPKDLELTMDAFGFTIDGVDENIQFDTALDALLAIDDRFGVFDDTFFNGDLEVMIDMATTLVPKTNSADTPVMEVTAGTVTESTSGDFPPGANFVTGSCFKINTSLTSTFDVPLVGDSCI